MSLGPKSAEAHEAGRDNFEAIIKDFKQRGSKLSGDQREFYLSILNRLESNLQMINDLRQEYRDLREKWGRLVKDFRARPKEVDTETAKKVLTHQTALLKKKIDMLVHKRQAAQDKCQELELVLTNLLQPSNTKADNRIETIKNQLDKVSIKVGETNHVMKQYAKMINLLKDQKNSWAMQLEQATKVISRKHKDLADLKLIERDSNRSRHKARVEYLDYESRINQQKDSRENKITKQRTMLRRQALERMDSRQPEYRKPPSHIDSQASVMRSRTTRLAREKKEMKLREATSMYESVASFFGTVEPDRIVKLFEERRGANKALNDEILTVQSECKELAEIKQEMERKIDELGLFTDAYVGTTRLVNETKRELEKTVQAQKVASRDVQYQGYRLKEIDNAINRITDLFELLRNASAAPAERAQFLSWAKGQYVAIKEVLNEEDADPLEACDVKVLAQKIRQREEALFAVQGTAAQAPASPQKRSDVFKRHPRENKTDTVSRVLDRQKVKQMAKAATMKPVKTKAPESARRKPWK